MAEVAYLRLESGEIFRGFSFGKTKPISGELVFSTGMVGYVESLTDPSFKNQILILTYPLIGNYGVPNQERDESTPLKLLKHFESDRIHLSGLIISQLSHDYSHWNAKQSLDQWLQNESVPGIYGLDTRALTQLIREQGTCRAQIYYEAEAEPNFVYENRYLVSQVLSGFDPELEIPSSSYQQNSLGVKILVIDCGLKYNQIRCLLKYNVSLRIVPWDYDFLDPSVIDSFDRLFISNGPGDPMDCQVLIDNIRKYIEQEKEKETPRPLFGICLGHQLLSLAIGAKTYKMKYGNRGLNIPCQLGGTNRCIITSQNHGYAVDEESLPENWRQLFVNANDGSNEGIYYNDGPFYSVQFHPEAKPGPEDSEFLFKLFVENRMDEVWTVMDSSPVNMDSSPVRSPKTKIGLKIGRRFWS